jgi:hypothetical protein
MTVPYDRRITLTPAEGAALARIAPQGRFSCNPNGAVWPERTKGWHAPRDRMDVSGTFPGLDKAVELFLRSWPRGGGFRIDTDTFVRADGEQTFALWQLAA